MGQIVKFVELVHDCILSKQQRNEMNRRYCDAIWRAFVVFSNGKNGTIGRQIPFKVLPMVPLVIMSTYHIQLHVHTYRQYKNRPILYRITGDSAR